MPSRISIPMLLAHVVGAVSVVWGSRMGTWWHRRQEVPVLPRRAQSSLLPGLVVAGVLGIQLAARAQEETA